MCFLVASCTQTAEGGGELVPPSTTSSPTSATGSSTSAALLSVPPDQSFTVYVSLGGDNKVAVLGLDPDGGLTLRENLAVDVPGPAGAMVLEPLSNRLLVGVGNSIATIALDGPQPILIGSTPVDGEPVYIDHALDGQLLLAAYFGEDQVRSYALGGNDPAPQPYPRQQVDDSGIEPHAVVVNQQGTRAYAPHRNGEAVVAYSIEPAGVLKRIGATPTEPGTGPRHLVLSPDDGFAYVINEHADTVTVYEVDGVGMLQIRQTLSTLPDGFDNEANTGADIHLTPDGAFLYTSNRGHDSIAMFSVGSDGLLTALGQVPTQPRPRDFGMSPDGRFLVVAGQDSGFVEAYRIEADGRLTTVGSVAVGERPVWVTIVGNDSA